MKKFFTLAMAAVMFCGIANAQVTKADIKNQKIARTAVDAKPSKLATRNAKKAAKEGWVVAPGQLPLDKQFDKAYIMQSETLEDGMPKFIFGDAVSPGKFYDAAKAQALELAKENIAGQIQTEVTEMIENTRANEQIAQDDAESIARTVGVSKNLISQSLGRVITVVECYRTLPNNNVQVRIMLAYNHEMAMNAAKAVIKKQLEEKGQELHDQLDKVMGF